MTVFNKTRILAKLEFQIQLQIMLSRETTQLFSLWSLFLLLWKKPIYLDSFVCHHWSETTVFNRCVIKRKRWFKCHVPYYSNSDATFNFMELCITLSGDVHPLPGPERDAAKIPVCIGNSRVRNKNKVARGHVKSNCIIIQSRMPNSLKHRNNNKQLEIAHVNAASLKCRHHFHEIKGMALQKSFDILTFSETWFNSTTTNASVEIDGYSIYRLDRLRKTGAGVCAYVKHGLKVKVLKDLTEIGESGLHQLWLQVQNEKLRSLLQFTDLLRLALRVWQTNSCLNI